MTATAYRDDTKYEQAGRQVRLIAPRTREAVTPFHHARLGNCLRITLEPGDCSSTDADRKPPPARAMFAAEGYGSDKHRGKRLTQHATLLWDRWPKLKAGIFYVVAQWNVAPGKDPSDPTGKRMLPWGPPPAELDIAVRKNGKGKADTYHLVMKLNRAPGDPIGKPYWECWSDPLELGVPYSFGLAFVDGRGGKGRAEFWLGTRGVTGTKRLVGSYDGPTGRPGCSVPYPAVGAYRHPGLDGSDEMFLKNWRIAPAG